jgi:hypothetical protein
MALISLQDVSLGFGGLHSSQNRLGFMLHLPQE